MFDVVLIDDEYFFRNSLKNAVCWEELGLQIIGDANNGASGLQLILEKKPDIAIVDINMPVLTGLEMIEKLSEQNISCKYILLTGYGEFKYAQQAIRLGVSEYILKPVDFDLLIEALKTLKSEILADKTKQQYVEKLEYQHNIQTKNNFLLDLMNGSFSFNEKTISSYLTELNIQVRFTNYAVLLISFPKIQSDRLREIYFYLIEQLAEQIYFEKNEDIDSNFDLSTINTEIFPANHAQLCLIAELSPTQTLTSFINYIKTLLLPQKDKYHIGISSLHSNVEEIILAYDEAVLCLKNASSRNTVVFSHNQLNILFYHIPEKNIRTLKKLFHLKDLESTESLLTSLYSEFQSMNLSFDNVIFCTYELLSCLFSAMNKQNAMNCFSSSSFENPFDTIRSFHTYEELQYWITALFRKQIILAKKQFSDDLSVSSKVEQFIQKNYRNPNLNIDFIAKQLFMNYSYICYCFKRDRGITINDYINQFRLQKSLELFHSGLDNVGYVAELTGFNDASYFGKKFKKAFGLSPTEYLKII